LDLFFSFSFFLCGIAVGKSSSGLRSHGEEGEMTDASTILHPIRSTNSIDSSNATKKQETAALGSSLNFFEMRRNERPVKLEIWGFVTNVSVP
jgi:hypothetical protein